MTEKKRLLLIDDEPGVSIALKLLLEMHSFEVEAFNDPSLAIDFIANNLGKIDCILCDLRMPKLNGGEVLVKSKELDPNIPFVLMSGHAEEDEQQELLKQGAIAFLTKPFNPEELVKILSGCP